jgi:mRNA interferase MazF
MEKSSVAVCDQIRTVDKTRLRKQAGKFSIKEIMDLEDSLKQILSL